MVIVTGEYGQLGNRLIVYANLIAAAREHGFRLANPAFGCYASLFHSTGRDALGRYPAVRSGSWIGPALTQHVQAASVAGVRALRRIERRGWRIPGVRMLDIGWFGQCDLDGAEFIEMARRSGVLLLKGWQFRARSSFERHAGAIRTFFRPKGAHLERANECVVRLRRRADVVIGVHIRHGDYRTFEGGRYFYETERYVAWMRGLRETFRGRRVAFLVASNERQPAEEFDGLSIAFAPGEPVVDLHALAACDLIVGPPSTFSQWASFVGITPLCTLSSSDEIPLAERFAITAHFDETRQPGRAQARAAVG